MNGYYLDENDEFHCQRCLFATPHEGRIQTHVAERHDIEPAGPLALVEDVPLMKVADVLAAVGDGKIEMWDALEIELSQDHPRRMVVRGLRALAEKKAAGQVAQSAGLHGLHEEEGE